MDDFVVWQERGARITPDNPLRLAWIGRGQTIDMWAEVITQGEPIFLFPGELTDEQMNGLEEAFRRAKAYIPSWVKSSRKNSKISLEDGE